ncbi:MAG TPA: prephenate dehydratase [Chthonomonas sp.]|jgi:chorismate mutase/prephenate dehydratase|uniref:prephenate dehydratase n=1 Tax=Chthonomonas sp. TaxID=2282153 RepID=UPI002B4B01E0|nr:prephenate dehydratase [Chthonomonas sp.]HLH80574.1 prephenate dehydratase [Chthonomonas sp.]
MSLPEWRKEIDQIDEQILHLLNRRAELARQIGHAKSRTRSHYFTPEREHTVFRRLVQMNPGPLEAQAVRAIYREIISACRALEKPLTVAFLGPEGTFSHLAGIARFGSSSEFVPVERIAEVFAQVERGLCDYGVVPVENSWAGAVPETLDSFLNSNLRVVWEIYQPIYHNLLSRCTTLEEIKRLYSHFQPLAQCRQWLRNHLPHVEEIEASSTAKAAELASRDPESAAIATYLAAEKYDLPILCEHIEDDPTNRTRFLVLGYNEPEPTGKDKTSLIFTVPNRAGELAHALNAFEKYDVNLTMIETRPTRSAPWQYFFYVDLQGHVKDIAVSKALNLLKEHSLFVRVLGSYPEAS